MIKLVQRRRQAPATRPIRGVRKYANELLPLGLIDFGADSIDRRAATFGAERDLNGSGPLLSRGLCWRRSAASRAC